MQITRAKLTIDFKAYSPTVCQLWKGVFSGKTMGTVI
jgi:hypothetical protein